jgi:hypothetical protein
VGGQYSSNMDQNEIFFTTFSADPPITETHRHPFDNLGKETWETDSPLCVHFTNSVERTRKSEIRKMIEQRPTVNRYVSIKFTKTESCCP